jgi:hypothetical protein
MRMMTKRMGARCLRHLGKRGLIGQRRNHRVAQTAEEIVISLVAGKVRRVFAVAIEPPLDLYADLGFDSIDIIDVSHRDISRWFEWYTAALRRANADRTDGQYFAAQSSQLVRGRWSALALALTGKGLPFLLSSLKPCSKHHGFVRLDLSVARKRAASPPVTAR